MTNTEVAEYLALIAVQKSDAVSAKEIVKNYRAALTEIQAEMDAEPETKNGTAAVIGRRNI